MYTITAAAAPSTTHTVTAAATFTMHDVAPSAASTVHAITTAAASANAAAAVKLLLEVAVEQCIQLQQ